MYLFGEPQITRNVLKATEYIKMSADAGISIAKDYMAICYLFGIVVEKKEEFAIQLLEENFNLGDTLASYILSDIYQNGCGTIDQDEKKSIMYNSIARQNNIPRAEEQFRNILLHNINPTLKK